MPDWLTHTLTGWILGKTTKINIALVVIGVLIPDLVKINLAFVWTGFNPQHVFDPLHTPIGAFLIAGIGALFFEDTKKAFIPLSIGVVSHFVLDFFLVHLAGGTRIFFPLTWVQYNYSIIRSENYWMTVVAIIIALIVFLLYKFHDQRIKNPMK
jgi:hypothetical protein